MKKQVLVDDIITLVKKSAQLSIEESVELSALRKLFHRDAKTYLEVQAELRKMIEADIQYLQEQYKLQQALLEKIFR